MDISTTTKLLRNIRCGRCGREKTKASRARRMVRDGKAVGKRNKLGIYYIQLLDEPSGREKQSISAGIDPGKYYSGIGLQSGRFTLFTAHLFLPFEAVKKRIEQRRMMRQSLFAIRRCEATSADSSPQKR